MERWKYVEGFRERYQVSDQGNVRSRHKEAWRTLMPQDNGGGYQRVTLYDGVGHKSREFVHRLVATAFVPNPLRLPLVNHKNELPYDNVYTNLEWVDSSMNQRYGTVPERKSRGRRLAEERRRNYVLK